MPSRLTAVLLLLAVPWISSCEDAAKSSGAQGVSAVPTAALAEAGHVLRRLGFGPTPRELEEVARNGTAWYVAQQLSPEDLDESAWEPLHLWRALLPLPTGEADGTTLAELVERQYVRALWSPRQLSESMTLFWEGHFNTNYWTVFNFVGGNEARAAWIETRENELFRALALGHFEDLLRVSATSPAMLITLDNVLNVAGNPNENFARELVELFSMGVDNGYTQADVEELARCFTGWGVCEKAPADLEDPLSACASGLPGASLAFHFDPARHDAGPKTIFAGTAWELSLPARAGSAGLDDGLDVLRHLSMLPQTAEFVCRKLARKFIADEPPAALVAAARDTWLATGGDIREVLRLLLSSSEFTAPAWRWTKVETPFESLCSTVRALEGLATRRIELTNFRAVLEMRLRQSLFRWLTPDGFPEQGDEQLGTGRLLGRIAFNEWIHLGEGDDLHFDVAGLVRRHGAQPSNAASVVATLGRLCYQERFSPADAALAVEFLTTDEAGQPRPLDPAAADYDLRLKQLAAFMASLPQGVEQ
jgi:uncharacterized protein (DUF1800 family)